MEKLGHYYYTDGKTIYYHQYNNKKYPIPGVDLATFQVHDYCLASDANKVYAMSSMRESLQIFEPVDRGSVVFFPEDFGGYHFADDYCLYRYNGHFVGWANTNDTTETFVQLLQWLRSNYPGRKAWWNNAPDFYEGLRHIGHALYTDGRDMYYKFKAEHYCDYPNYAYPYTDDCLRLKEADPNSFTVLSEVYSKDKGHVYFYSRWMAGADPATFRLLDGLFAQDRSGIWFNGRHCPDITDLAAFRILTPETEEIQYAVDGEHVYCASGYTKIGPREGYANQLIKLRNSDAKTFSILNDCWAKDKNQVYRFGTIFKKADVATFEALDVPQRETRFMARDKNNVYWGENGSVRKGLHGGSFRILNPYWAQDDHAVFNLRSERLYKNMDAATFEVLDDHGGARDKDFTYRMEGFDLVKAKR